MSQSVQTYRPEIDGMRAIAVVAVIVYHLKIAALPLTGGFLGVDLFFVLSGFLISGILIDEFHRTGRISIGRFYWRRARRILPPLLLVMLASLPAAWLLLLPTELERFSLSLAAALAFVSNIFWFFELSEYGAQSGLLQPFLHTWSLAIEEQFYLVFPPLLIVLLPRLSARGVLWTVAGLTAAALAVAVATTAVHPAFSFYAPTSRAWEMLVGALLAVVVRRPGLGRLTGGLWRAVPALSLLVLLGAFATQDLVEMAHPGIGTLPVILATCGLIWCADPREPVTRLLASAPMVAVGKLSYSLYLWHFPVFAFGRILAVGPPGPLEMAAWLALTVALSVAGYRLVEVPFRFRVPPRPFFAATLAALVPIAAVAVLSLTGSGQGGRAEALAALYGENEIDNAVLARRSWGLLDARFPDEEIGPWNALRPSESGTADLWFEGEDTRKVLLIGDSLSKDLYNAFVLNADRFPGHEFARFNLHRRSLRDDLATLVRTPNFAAADVVVIAPNYYREYRRALGVMLNAIDGAGKEIVVVGNTARFDAGGTQPLFDWFLLKAGDAAILDDLNALAPKYEDARARTQNAEIRRIAEAAGATYLSRRDLVCPSEAVCTLVTEDGFKTMYDGLHWTLEGAALFGARAAEAGWLGAAPGGAGEG